MISCDKANRKDKQEELSPKRDTVYIYKDVSTNENATDIPDNENNQKLDDNVSHETHEAEPEPETFTFEPQKEIAQCYLCYGTCRCGVCGGGGTLYRSGELISCTNCGGSGACPACNGSGFVEQIAGPGW